MSNAFPVFATISAALVIAVAGGCHSPATSAAAPAATSPSNIVLQGFSEGNYAALGGGLGQRVCIKGRLSVDSVGVYYPLQPAEEEDVVNIGFSRINTGLNRIDASRKGLTNGRLHTICGVLVDATPFKNCNSNHCKWYSLTDAKPQRRR